MTREDQLREARRFLGLPHPADDDDVSKALRYIEFRNQAFLAAKKRHSKPAKRVARSLAQAIWRGQRAGLPMPQEWASLFHLYQDIGTTRSGAPKRADGFKKRLALQQAFWLLNDRNRPCVAGRNCDWCKLGAILYGNPRAEMLSQCRELRTRFRLEPGQN
jgi:hypothetical protein